MCRREEKQKRSRREEKRSKAEAEALASLNSLRLKGEKNGRACENGE